MADEVVMSFYSPDTEVVIVAQSISMTVTEEEMIDKETTIEVMEGNDPLLEISLTTVSPAGAYNLENVQGVEFIVKKGKTTPDADAKFTKTVGAGVTITDPVGGVIQVQLDAADLDDAAPHRYKIDVIKNNKRDTVAAGPFIIYDL